MDDHLCWVHVLVVPLNPLNIHFVLRYIYGYVVLSARLYGSYFSLSVLLYFGFLISLCSGCSISFSVFSAVSTQNNVLVVYQLPAVITNCATCNYALLIEIFIVTLLELLRLGWSYHYYSLQKTGTALGPFIFFLF